MAESLRLARLIEWALGTFHAITFFLVLIIIAFVSGILGTALAALNTLVGVLIFAFFWMTTWAASHRTLKGAGQSIVERQTTAIKTRTMFLRGFFYGGINGVIFLVVGSLVFVAILLTESTQPLNISILYEAGIAYLFAIAVGGGFAFFIGGIIGLVFVAIDFVLLAAARLVFSLILRSSPAQAS